MVQVWCVHEDVITQTYTTKNLEIRVREENIVYSFKGENIVNDLRMKVVDDINRGESNLSSNFFRTRSRKKLSTNRVKNVTMFAINSSIFLGGVRA